MIDIKGTKTEKNILTAFAGESQARNRYTFFSSVAKKEGYEQIAAIFEETANQEKEHAKRFFKFLKGGALEITSTFPAGMTGTTEENLLAAANGEHEEWTVAYPQFAKIAADEGFPAVSIVFDLIAQVEKVHEECFRALLTNIKEGRVFVRGGATEWQCRNCGLIYRDLEAPAACPVCAHPRAYFQLFVPAW